MRRESALLVVVILAALAMSTACKRGAEQTDLSKLGPSSAATTTVLPAGSQICPGGGIGIYAGSDANGNGVLDAAEVTKGSPVCDQTADDGSPAGNNTLVVVASEPSGTVHCAAGGLKVLSGPDANRNGVLDASEVAFTDYLCNGTPGSSSAAGITVVAGAPAAPGVPDEGKTKGGKKAPPKKPKAAAGKPAAKAADKAAPKPAPRRAAEAKAAPAAPAKQEKAEAAPAPERKEAPAEPAAPPKKAGKKEQAADKEKTAPAKQAAPVKPAAPEGWTSVTVNNPQIASVAYKIEGRYILVRFTNRSSTSSVRFKYTVRWKVNQNGNWVEDSTMEGISFRLKPQESLDREVRTSVPDIRDVVIDLDVVETG